MSKLPDSLPPLPEDLTFFTVQEVAAMLKLSQTVVRQLFTGKPGVIVHSQPRPGRRAYGTMRISAVAIRQIQCR